MKKRAKVVTVLAFAAASACGGAPPKNSAIADRTVTPANAADVQRYPDEVPLDEQQIIEWKAAPVRTKHPDGELVAILTRGNATSKVARRGDFFLVTFPNPDDPQKRWEGWVHKNVFLPGTEPFPPIGNPMRCMADGDCGTLARCRGVASAGPSGLEGFRFCTGKPVK
jgi:hypothetical protein